MEKQRKIRNNKFSARFLVYFLTVVLFSVVHIPSYAQRLTYSMIMDLSVHTVNEKNFSNSDVAFELKIPYVKSDVVQAQIPDLPSGVNFVSLRRSEYSDTTSGTKIELWLNFSDSGRYNLRYMRVFINNRAYNIPFEPVIISDNPRNMLPQLVVTFDNGVEFIQQHRGKPQNKPAFVAHTGDVFNFTVSLQYAVQIISYNWSVPKNALFLEKERYEITKGTIRSSVFSEDTIPVASFEWEPLLTGNLYLPDLKIIATSYNGTRVELGLEDAYIQVLEGKNSVKRTESYEDLFAYAFTKNQKKQTKLTKNVVSAKACDTIAQLRSQERNSLPFGYVYKQRKNAEARVGITESQNEPTKYTLWFCLALMVLCIILLVISIVIKKLPGILIFSALSVLLLIFSIIQLGRLSATYGIFIGGNISPIPEEQVDAVVSIESGKRVKIAQTAGDWVYVEYGSTGGWAKENNIYFIKK